MQQGFLQAPWNVYVAQQKVLAGVAPELITSLLEPETYRVAAPERAWQDAAARQRLLDRLRSWSLHGGPELAPWARPWPGTANSFQDEMAQWQELVADYLQRLHGFQAAFAQIEERYLGGKAALLQEQRECLERWSEAGETLGSVFNTAVVAVLGAVMSKATTPEPIEAFDCGPYRDRATTTAERAAYLVDLAKVEALQVLDEDNLAVDLMGKYIEE